MSALLFLYVYPEPSFMPCSVNLDNYLLFYKFVLVSFQTERGLFQLAIWYLRFH